MGRRGSGTEAGRRLGRRPALDGIRAVAVAAVLVQHLGMPWFANVGVLLFFTLSGFLITTLLLEEAAEHGRVRLLQFWGRRALRLFPALAVCLAAVAVYCVLVPEFLFGPPTLNGLPWALGYVANWRIVEGHSLGLFQHLWSLAVEEQFYLLWPLLVALFAAKAPAVGREVTVLVLSVGGILAVFVQRALLMPGAVDLERIAGTDVIADQLLVGCALAAVWRLLQTRPARWHRAASWGALAAAAGCHVWLAGAPAERPFPGGSPSGAYLALAMANAAIIAHVVLHERSPVTRVLAARPLVAIGKRSYALYLWQLPVIGFVAYYVANTTMAKTVVGVPVILALAWLSYRFVEVPFLRLKDRLRPRAATAADAPAPAIEPAAAPVLAPTVP